MNRAERPLVWPLVAMLGGWLLISGIGAWCLSPLTNHSQFLLISAMPWIAAALAVWRWPWRSAWRWQMDSWSIAGLLGAVAASGLTLWFADPLLIAMASLLLGLVICRGVVSENRWPLRGAWLPLVFPLLLLLGLDGRLTRWHDGVVQEEVAMLLDAMAFPNDGFRTLPTDQLLQTYVVDYSGNPWCSWGQVMALALILAGLMRRRGLPAMLLMASGLGWAIILNVSSLIWPFAVRRFAGPINDEPLLSHVWSPLVLVLAVALLWTTDQFFRFVFAEVEPDEDDESMSGRLARLWNRMTSDQLTPRQSQRLRRGEWPDGLIFGCLGMAVVLSALFMFRANGFYAWRNPQPSGDIPLTLSPPDDGRFRIEEGVMERNGAGSRFGDRSWRWVVGGELGRAVLNLNVSPSAQYDLLHQLRMMNWRIIAEPGSNPTEASSPADTQSEPYDWSTFRLEKPKDELASIRHRGLLVAVAARLGGEGGRHPTTLIGRFPNWSGEPLVGSRWEGKLRRTSVLVWLLADGFHDYPAEEISAWEGLVRQFVATLPELTTSPNKE